MSPVSAPSPGRVRRAGSGDLDGVVAHWKAISAHHEPLDPQFALAHGSEAEVRRLLAAQLRDPDAATWVFDRGGEVVGLCIARIDRAPPIARETARAEITDLGVAPAWRRHGIGRALVEEALAWIVHRRVDRVEVRVAVGNREGHAFWRSQGFGDLMDVLQRRL